MTDGIQAVVSRHDYLAFGDEVTETVGNVGGRTSAQGYGETDEIRKQYTGYERDTESGLDYAQARYYNSDHGRFTSVDPLTASANVKNPQTFNRYSYVLNSPYKFTDPLGLLAETTGACGSRCPQSIGDGFNGGTVFDSLDGRGYEGPWKQQTQQNEEEDKTKILKIDLEDTKNLLDAENLEAMKNEITEIFSELNVEVQFVTQDADYTLFVVQSTEDQSTADPLPIGVTRTDSETGEVRSYGYIGIDQLKKSINSTSEGATEFGRDKKALGKALGRAGAHEIGHYLLQINTNKKHEGYGIMRYGFTGFEWFSGIERRKKFYFTKKQKKKIRSILPDKEP